jgi:hypothetical protein
MALAAATEASASPVAVLDRAVAPWPRVTVVMAAASALQLPWAAGVRWRPF